MKFAKKPTTIIEQTAENVQRTVQNFPCHR